MAQRRLGTLPLQENIETEKQMPLDARQLVRSKEEMLTEGSFTYGYKGLFTAERTEGKLWMLMDHQNPTQEASWKVIGPYDDSALDARVTALENASPSEQVQANWNETDTTSKAFIQNKPSFASVATSGSYNDLADRPVLPAPYDDSALSGRVSALENAGFLTEQYLREDVHNGNELNSIVVNNDDETSKVTITGVSIPYKHPCAKIKGENAYVHCSNGSEENGVYEYKYIDGTVAFTVTVREPSIPGLPGFPDNYKDNDIDYPGPYTITFYHVDDIISRVQSWLDISDKANVADLSTVATSGSYNDLTNKPTIPAAVTVDSAMSDTSENPVQNKVVLTAIGDAIDVVETAIQGLDARVTAAESSVAALTANAPAAFDTLKEVADWIAADETGTQALIGRVAALENAGYLTSETQADWNESDTTSAAYIANKPTIPAAYDDTALAARVTAVEEALNLTALTDEEIAALVPA